MKYKGNKILNPYFDLSDILDSNLFVWRKLYDNNYIPNGKQSETDLRGYYLLLFKRINKWRIDGFMMTIDFQREQRRGGIVKADAKVEAYNLFYHVFEDVRGPLEIPINQYKNSNKEFESSLYGHLSCYDVNIRDKFIRSFSSLGDAKKGAMFWLKVWGDIDNDNVIPYGTIRNDAFELHKREVREAELYITLINKYTDIIEIIKKYDYPGNAIDEISEVLGIDRDDVVFIYNMFDPLLFSSSTIQSLGKLLSKENDKYE